MMQRDVGLAAGETVDYVVTRHPLFLIIGCVPPAISLFFGLSVLLLSDGNSVGIGFGVMLLLFAVLFLWKTWLDFSYDAIYLTNFRLIFLNKHLLGYNVNQMNYSAITNVKPSYPSILSYIFRYGSLHIETAADHPGEVYIEMVRSHEKAAQYIMQKSLGQKTTSAPV